MKTQKMKFYIRVTAVCNECDYTEAVLIGHDKVIYHECNQGNRVSYVPKTIR